MPATWEDLKHGVTCPLCSPRRDINEHHYLVRKLRTSSFYLNRGQWYLGTSALIFDLRHLTYISQLSNEEWTQFSLDLREAEGALHRAFAPDHLNIECLGNTVPHLHVWLIPRYRDDGRWGHPIWTVAGDDRDQRLYTDEQLAVIAERIRGHLDNR